MAIRWESIPLARGERAALRRALHRFDPATMTTTVHMAERHIPLRPRTLWLFYVPDFTNIFRAWYGRYIDGIISTFHPEARVWIAFEDGFLLLKYAGERPRSVVRRWCEEKRWDAVERILQDAFAAECACAEAIDDFAKKRSGIAGLIDAMTRFAAYGLDTVFPEDLLEERFPGVDASLLYWSPVSSWRILLEESIKSVERIYGGSSEEKEIAAYARQFSRLSWGTIRSRDYDRAFARSAIRRASSSFPDMRSIWNRSRSQAEETRLYGSCAGNYVRYVDTCSRDIPREDRELWACLVRFATEAQRYNEMRRIYFTKTLQLVRDFAEDHGVDWRTVSLEKLCEMDEQKKGGRKHGGVHFQRAVA